MKRIQVQFHGKVVNMALPETGVLSAIVSCVDRRDKDPDSEEEVRLHLGGLDNTDGKHPQWGDFDLQPGDQVVMSIHDDRISDPPIDRRGLSSDETQMEKKNYVRKMAKDFGWTIVEGSS
jgi:hypothetical protein